MSTTVKARYSPTEREIIRKEVLAREIATFDRYVIEKAMGKNEPKTDQQHVVANQSFRPRSVS